MYDLIIIGMGISGITAGIYAKRAGLKVLILEENTPGGVINNINKIENYPGFKSISGPDLAYSLFDEINELNIEYKIEKVTDIILEKVKIIKTNNNIYHTQNILIATGRKALPLGIENEEKYFGKGISTCAICDGPLYKGKDVAVIGGGSSALSESLYLANIVNKVYLIHRRDEFRAEKTLVEELENINNIEIIYNNEVEKINEKDNRFAGIALKDGKVLDVAAMFVYIGYKPNTEFLENTAVKLDKGYIVVDNKYETNIKGVYAAGDVIKKDIHQIINAASEGAEASINIANEKNSN